jgi:carboxylesterase type B
LMRLLLLSLLLLLLAAPSHTLEYDTRNTSLGAVRGIVNETNQCLSWRGVFYAASTGGDNRFRAPQPRAAWAPAVLDATAFGAGCLQIDHNADVPTNQSEDCLSLNVFAPLEADASSLLPVLIWFHGGTFKEGWSEGPFDLYDGCNMAQGGRAIVVTANYRLGALGFAVTTSGRGEEEKYNLKGQFGLYDQVAAMEWVRDNIAAFGGDPASVTLFGQSAGSMSVGLHYVAPSSYTSGLFHRVIMESNYAGSNLHSLADASKLGDDFCHLLGCFAAATRGVGGCDVGCMRAANASAVENAWRTAQDAAVTKVATNSLDAVLDSIMAFAPVLDGDSLGGDGFLPCQITDCLSRGAFDAAIPALFGTAAGDGATFIYSLDRRLPFGVYEDVVDVVYHDPPGTADTILAYYGQNFSRPLDGRAPLAQVVNDYLFRCSSEVYGREISARNGSAFAYVFDYVWEMAWLFPEFGLPDACATLPCHSEEIPFVFNNTVPGLNASFTAAEQALAATMVTWWTNFARNGDPNDGAGGRTAAAPPAPPAAAPAVSAPPAPSAAPGAMPGALPQWPRFTADGRETMHITLDSYVESGGVALCAGMWDGVGYGY